MGLLNEHEVADRLGLSVHTIRSWRRQGIGVSYVKIGYAVRYREIDLATFIDAHAVEIRIRKR